MIVETIFSTVDEAGNPNFAPMGIGWEDEFAIVRPFRNTQTCRNLLSTGCGVANLADDVLAYVQCALYDAVLPHFPAKTVRGVIFKEACSWRELMLESQSGTEDRAEFCCRVLHSGRQKDFLGFRRASNAVIEATIMATRLQLLDPHAGREWLAHFAKIVDKTGDVAERQAFQLVHDYILRGNR
jgi:uncharacterized protein